MVKNIVIQFYVYVVTNTMKNPYLRTNLDVRRIRRKPKVEYFLNFFHVIFAYELGKFRYE